MHTTTRIACDIDNLSFEWWDGTYFRTSKVGEDAEAACAALGCSKEMLGALVWLTWHIRRAVSNDLRDIWRRLDQLEALIQKEE